MSHTITGAIHALVPFPFSRFQSLSCARRNCTRLVAIGIAMLGASHSGAQTVGWWRFDEAVAGSVATLPASIIDVSGGNNGSPFGGPLYATALDACATGGLTFDGVSSRVAVPDSPAYANLQSMTIEVELATSGYQPSQFGLNQIVFRGDDRGGLDPFFLAIQADGSVAFYLNNVFLVQSPGPIPVGQFMHVAATLDDASGSVKLFLDRAQVASTTTNQRPNTTLLTGANPGVGIGNLQSGNFAQSFAGTIYELRLSSTSLSTEAMLPARPSIGVQPESVQMCRSETATFTSTATGSGALTYLWQWQPAPGGAWTDLVDGINAYQGQPALDVTGATDPTLRPRALWGLGGNLPFRCIVSNACGSVTSNVAMLAICAADFNCDGFLDFTDFDGFVTAFEAGAPASDFNADGFLDFTDFDAFVGTFEAGC